MEYKSIINISSTLRALLEYNTSAQEDEDIKRAIEKLEKDTEKFNAQCAMYNAH